MCLPSPKFKPPTHKTNRAVCVISGWGKTVNPDENRHLQMATIPIMSNAECNELYGSNMLPDIRNICAGFVEGNIDTCNGDSGQLSSRFNLVLILSRRPINMPSGESMDLSWPGQLGSRE